MCTIHYTKVSACLKQRTPISVRCLLIMTSVLKFWCLKFQYCMARQIVFLGLFSVMQQAKRCIFIGEMKDGIFVTDITMMYLGALPGQEARE